MYQDYVYYGDRHTRRKSQKLLSVTTNGKLTFKRFDGVVEYLLSQDLNYFTYQRKKMLDVYFLIAAKMLIKQKQNRWATKFYYYAMELAISYKTHYIINNRLIRENLIDPMVIYKIACQHLYNIGNFKEKERFKKRIKNEYIYLQLEYDLKVQMRHWNKLDKIEDRLTSAS